MLEIMFTKILAELAKLWLMKCFKIDYCSFSWNNKMAECIMMCVHFPKKGWIARRIFILNFWVPSFINKVQCSRFQKELKCPNKAKRNWLDLPMRETRREVANLTWKNTWHSHYNAISHISIISMNIDTIIIIIFLLVNHMKEPL